MNLNNAFPDEHQPRVLVVEDTLIVADEIVRMIRDLGCSTVGPIAWVEQAMDLAADAEVDAAVLDVNLNDEAVFPAAEILLSRGIPVAFLTGYSRHSLPGQYREYPCLEKPFSRDELAHVLEGMFAARTR